MVVRREWLGLLELVADDGLEPFAVLADVNDGVAAGLGSGVFTLGRERGFAFLKSRRPAKEIGLSRSPRSFWRFEFLEGGDELRLDGGSAADGLAVLGDDLAVLGELRRDRFGVSSVERFHECAPAARISESSALALAVVAAGRAEVGADFRSCAPKRFHAEAGPDELPGWLGVSPSS